MNPEERNGAASDDAREISVFDVVLSIARRKRLVVGVPIVASIVAALISLVLPSFYTATTRLLPPQQGQSSNALLLGQLGGLASGGGGAAIAALKNPSDLFVAMLKSRNVADKLVERFRLRERYGAQLVQDAREKLMQ